MYLMQGFRAFPFSFSCFRSERGSIQTRFCFLKLGATMNIPIAQIFYQLLPEIGLVRFQLAVTLTIAKQLNGNSNSLLSHDYLLDRRLNITKPVTKSMQNFARVFLHSCLLGNAINLKVRLSLTICVGVSSSQNEAYW